MDAPHGLTRRMPPMEQPLMIPISASRYRLVRQYGYRWPSPAGEQIIEVPKGTETDGASVPRLLWSLTGITPDGLHRPAALIHDWLYMHAGRIDMLRLAPGEVRWARVRAEWSRRDADRLFCRILREAGVPMVRRRLMYRAVRVGGWWPWWRQSMAAN